MPGWAAWATRRDSRCGWKRTIPSGTRPRPPSSPACSPPRSARSTSRCRRPRAPPTARPTPRSGPTSSANRPLSSCPPSDKPVLPVFTADEMRRLDARAIAELKIPGARLMENAGAGAARLIAEEFAPLRGTRVVVVCGKGNNGGDGFVVARHLRARGAKTQVFLIGRRGDLKGDAAGALARWRGRVEEILAEPALGGLKRALA